MSESTWESMSGSTSGLMSGSMSESLVEPDYPTAHKVFPPPVVSCVTSPFPVVEVEVPDLDFTDVKSAADLLGSGTKLSTTIMIVATVARAPSVIKPLIGQLVRFPGCRVGKFR